MERPSSMNPESDPATWRGKVKNTETGEVFDPHKLPYKSSDTLSLDGIYEHYKSTPEDPKYYQVSGVVENTETGECFVVYEPLYETDDQPASARPLRMFTEEVEFDGSLMPRFRFVTDDFETM